MILINHENKLRLKTNNKSLVARMIGYSRVQVWRWSKRYDKKTTWGNKFTVYFDESLLK